MNKRYTIKALRIKLQCASALLIALACLSASADHSSPDSISRFASGAPGSGIAQQTERIALSLWENSSEHSSHLSSHHFGVATSSAGSGTNLENLSDGRVEFAVARADLARAAFTRPKGVGLNFNAQRIRLVSHLVPAMIHILVRKDITDAPASVADLQGRAVSIGLPGNMAQYSLQALFEAHGVSWRSLALANYPVNESYPKLVAGQLDAIIIIDQPESPQLAELLKNQQNQLLALDPAIITDFIQKSPDSHAYRLDNSTLQFHGRTVTTMAIDMLLLAQETVGPESVALVLNHITRSENHKTAFRDPGEGEGSKSFGIELHPAASDARQSAKLSENAAATDSGAQATPDPNEDSE